MRAKPMILIVVALACGLVASIGISQVMDRNAQNTATDTVEICVTSKAMDIGAKLDAEALKMESWPKDRVPEGAVTSIDEAKGQYTAQRLYPGEPILKAKLEGDLTGAIKHIPDGFTVVSVSVTMDTAVSGLIKPGDHVDVMVYLNKNGEITQTITRTILRKVRVFAVNEQMSREADKEGDKGAGSRAKTVSLLVRPVQAERLTLANEMGKIRLALRRPDDVEGDDTPGASISDLGFEGVFDRSKGPTKSGGLPISPPSTSQASTASSAKPAPGGTDFMSFLKSAATAATESVAHQSEFKSATESPPAPEYVWSMDVFTPEGPTRFQWKDERALPSIWQADGSEKPIVSAMGGGSSKPAESKPANDKSSSLKLDIPGLGGGK